MKTYALLCLSFGSLMSSAAYATENGDTTWPLGVQTVVPALVPAPGETSFYSYTVYYHADKTVDGKGHSAVPGFKLDNYVQALRVVHTWDLQTDFGLRLSSGVIGNGGHVKVEASGKSASDTGMRQAYITPLNISYSPSANLNLTGGLSLFTPLGNYDKNSLANASPNYRTYVAEFAATWFPSQNWEISIAPTFSFNERNKDTGYKSGDVMNIDYGVGYRFASMPKLQVGLAGYYTDQYSDDDLSGQVLPSGNRLKKLAVGPQLLYNFDEKSGVALKWLHEAEVENGPQGHSIWLQAAIPL
ncbi:SphA family protein [Pseudomonas sp. JBR1]|uniref:SphA family protein n=1 Tax=Pseudomonas sp. JBR1 TaxID=3020907 RepID=UPI002304F017|nr:transporter [Pseudomonas sp. JBR1]WCE09747.1 transporter [Pseudomonas sp. JBR1]